MVWFWYMYLDSLRHFWVGSYEGLHCPRFLVPWCVILCYHCFGIMCVFDCILAIKEYIRRCFRDERFLCGGVFTLCLDDLNRGLFGDGPLTLFISSGLHRMSNKSFFWRSPTPCTQNLGSRLPSPISLTPTLKASDPKCPNFKPKLYPTPPIKVPKWNSLHDKFDDKVPKQI